MDIVIHIYGKYFGINIIQGIFFFFMWNSSFFLERIICDLLILFYILNILKLGRYECTLYLCSKYLLPMWLYSQITIHFRLLIEYMGTFFKTHYLFECTTYLISRVSKYVVCPKIQHLENIWNNVLTLRKLKYTSYKFWMSSFLSRPSNETIILDFDILDKMHIDLL